MQSDLHILFLDDHPGLRDGTALLLSQKAPALHFMCAGTMQEALEIVQNTSPDLALIDLNLAGEDGLSAIKQFRSIVPGLKVIIYTMYADPYHIKNALQSNVQGYITKNTDITELMNAITSVAGGGSAFCPAASKIMNTLLSGEAAKNSEDFLFINYQALSKSEQTLFELLAKKTDLAEIAAALGKKEKTILNKRTILYQKMGFHDRLDLAEAARKLGVIE
ncbi:MAG: response regulator transcription factor [Treponema sp.]|nr:response regulator transcription factor [Treponema sp.]